MTRAMRLPYDVVKEIQALLPIWLASLLAMGAAGVLGNKKVYAFGVLAYFLGSVALGAQSMGHEYTNRTLTLLLSQPVSRRRLFLVKLGVLAPMLLMLAVVAWAVLFNSRDLHFGRDWAANPPGTTVLMLAVLCGVCLAPWFTMVCRSTLAGVIFTICTPGMASILSAVLTVVQFGNTGMPGATRFELAVFRWSVLGCCAVAGVLNWRMFSRLEAIDGPHPEVRLPSWLRGRTSAIDAASLPPARSRYAYWLLVKKELRLQQMTFVVAGIYLLMCAAMLFIRSAVPGFFGRAIGPITILYSGLLAVLIGSLASAEERQFGTLEWQVLMPMATWKQWAVKLGTVLGVALLLLVGLPVLLASMLRLEDHIRITAWGAGTMMFLIIGSLYVSSLCTSGVRALLLSFLVLFGLGLVAEWFGAAVQRSLHQPLLWLAGLAGFVALALRFGLVNHRSAERGAGRVWRQAIWMGGCLTLGVTALLALSR